MEWKKTSCSTNWNGGSSLTHILGFYKIEIKLNKYNVCVIGSGPAAMATSVILAKYDIKTLLVYHESLPANKAFFGETLSDTVIPLLASLGLPLTHFSNMPRIHKTISSWGSEELEDKTNLMLPSGVGWLLNREQLQNCLRTKALEMGCRICYNKILNVDRSSFEWMLTLDVNPQEIIKTDFIVNATGRATSIISNLPKTIILDKLVAFVVSFKDKNYGDDNSIYLDSSESGWFFSIGCTDGRRTLNYFTDGDLFKERSIDFFIEFLKKKLPSLPSISRVIKSLSLEEITNFQIVSANTTFRQFSYSEGVFVCGDAAQTLDPLSSQGISNAINDGILVAQAIEEIYRENKNAVRDHESIRREYFTSYLKNRNAVYLMEKRWTDNTFWKRRQELTNLKSFMNKF